MISKTEGLLTVLFIYLIVLAGASIGAATAYEADSYEATNIVYDGGTLTIAGETANVNTTINETKEESSTLEQWGVPTVTTPYDDEIRSGVYSFAETFMHVVFTIAFTVADVTASLVYYIAPVVPQWLLGGVLQLGMIVPMIGALGYAFKDIASLIK